MTHSTSGKAGCVLGHRVLQPRHNLTQPPDSAHTKTCFDAHAWREGIGMVRIHSGYSQDFLPFSPLILISIIFLFLIWLHINTDCIQYQGAKLSITINSFNMSQVLQNTRFTQTLSLLFFAYVTSKRAEQYCMNSFKASLGFLLISCKWLILWSY